MTTIRFLLDAFYYVPRLAGLMIAALWRNRHKYSTGHWLYESKAGWLSRLDDEVRELKDAVNNAYLPTSDPKAVKREAADVANFAMMVGFTKPL